MPKRYFLTIKTIELLCEILIRNNDKKENNKIVEMQGDRGKLLGVNSIDITH